jgi:hypothetical protein
MKSSVRATLHLISYNLLVFFVLANILYWSIPVINSISAAIRGEQRAAGAEYRSFIGWRTLPIERPEVHARGEPYTQRQTINGRRTREGKAYFFGGSAMWGFGAPDSETIPSLFAAATGMHSENYADFGYTSHQNLVLLLQLLQADHRPALVIFYDGVNEVAVKCQRGLTPESHSEEKEMNSLLQGFGRPSSFTHYFRPIIRLAERINSEVSKTLGVSTYDCVSDRIKAETIAGNLIRDWQFAKLLVESFGGKFVGILQPVIYFSQTCKDHLILPPNLDRQYQAVYPLIRDTIATHGSFYDFVSVLDVNEQIYLDFSHITPKGNRYIVQRISDITATMSFAR